MHILPFLQSATVGMVFYTIVAVAAPVAEPVAGSAADVAALVEVSL